MIVNPKVTRPAPLRMWRLLLFAACIGLLLGSCRSSKALAETSSVKKLPVRQLVKNYRGVPDNIRTLKGRVRVDYREGDKYQSTTMTFRIQRDSAIWLSAPLGMLKAMVTPQSIRFYNRLDNTFFEGDFDYLREIAGVDLDFYLLEDILLGESMLNLKEGNYRAEVNQGEYALLPRKNFQGFELAIFLNPKSFRVSRQYVSDPLSRDSLRIYYGYGGNERGLPERLRLEVEYGTTDREITLEYRNLERNQSLRFPYRVPRGYKKIEIKP